ncbi:PD-(D/E)XK nuclease family protein [Kocuria sp. CNJ-770]|uniref:PD-(D/E)XK nuclease family protein n=1 Tax=Kocuria sp. CNJ-770 TaxID=1904964 RepID=UPI000ACB51A4|nr:PD-(D/E)XK nuclease family protein [Kocuria sp. CNJ-770]
MTPRSTDMSGFVTALVPMLSRSLAEDFNVFRVMHHGTHEKQLSNVFAWLLAADATHGLGDAFQCSFLERINAGLPSGKQLPSTGYRVTQEVDTRRDEEVAGGQVGMDIADIVLSQQAAAVVVENYGTSDGHGHDYQRYLDFAVGPGRAAAVVLLCHRRAAHRQQDGWEDAVVVTYAEVLGDLHAHIYRVPSWRRGHSDQFFFIQQMIDHFVEGPAAVNPDDQISFIQAMCETGESARYGYQSQDRATQEFADLVAEHARRQFEDSRKTLATVKAQLQGFARTTLTDQLNEKVERGQVQKIEASLKGIWQWCVALHRADEQPTILLVFGPTAVVKNEQAPQLASARPGLLESVRDT